MSKTIEVTKYEEMCLNLITQVIGEMIHYTNPESVRERQSAAEQDNPTDYAILDSMIQERNSLVGFVGKLQGLYSGFDSINEKLKAK